METQMNRYYYERARKLATVNTEPSLTDQSQARETDINVIVGRFIKTGQAAVPGSPMYGDFSQLPSDLRGFIHTAQRLDEYRSHLPQELAEMTTEDLLRLTPAELTAKLQPHANEPTNTSGNSQNPPVG